MRIEFDPAKDSANKRKHGVSLALAEELDWDAALVWIDVRFGNDEWRMIALAPKLESSTTWPLWIVVRCEGSSVCAAPIVARWNTMSKVS